MKQSFHAIVLSVFFVLMIFTQTEITHGVGNTYWTNNAGGNITNNGNWIGGFDSLKNANFTNNASYNVSFSSIPTNTVVSFEAIGGTVTQSIGSQAWIVTESYTIGNLASSTSTVYQSGGTLNVTNAGTAFEYIGSSGVGTYILAGGTNNVDNVYIGSGSSGNSLIISNGGFFQIGPAAASIMGAGSNNLILIEGSGSIFTSSVGSSFQQSGFDNNKLIITNGGKYFNDTYYLALNTADTNQQIIVNGSGSRFSGGTLHVGFAGYSNSLTIANAGAVDTATSIIGYSSNADFNLVTIKDSGSVWTNANLYVGYIGSHNSLIITNGGTVVSTNSVLLSSISNAGVGGSYIPSDNKVLVTGAGSFLDVSNGYISVGEQGSSNQLTVAQGAMLRSLGIFIGNWTNANANTMLVTDSGTIVSNNTGTTDDGIYVGDMASFNKLIVSNGAIVYTKNLSVSLQNASSNNSVWITDPGSILSVTNTTAIGSNVTFTTGIGASLWISNGGTLEVGNSLVSGFANSGRITNFNSIFQFTTDTPTVTTNTANSIVLIDGMISYRNVTNANIFNSQVSNIVSSGNGTIFRLNASSNKAIAEYTFSNNNAGIYENLSMINGGTYWTSAVLNIGQSATLLISNTTANIAGLVSNNLGSIHLSKSDVTFKNELRIKGTGTNSLGAINNLTGGGTNALTGSVVLIGNATIGTEGGKLIFVSTITNGGFILSVTNAATTTLVFSNTVSGTGSLTVTGPGTTVLAASNTMSGNVLIDSGTIHVDGAGALSAVTNVTLSANGTLLLNTNHSIKDDASFTFAGGTLNMNDYNETVSNLTLSAYSTIILGNADSTTEDLIFYSNTVYTAGDIVINNWVGTSEGASLNKDRIKFIGTPSSTLLSHIWFSGYSDPRAMYLSASQEIVPVPEPGTIFSGLMALSLLASRKRWKKQKQDER